MEERKTDRELRCEVQTWDVDESKVGAIQFSDGALGRNIYIKDNVMEITFSDRNSGCYVDDVLARLRDVLFSYPTVDDDTKDAINYIQNAIDSLDKRAVKKHGYSWSELSREYVPPYLKKDSVIETKLMLE